MASFKEKHPRDSANIHFGLPCTKCIQQLQSYVIKKLIPFATTWLLHQSTAASTCWCGSRPRLGWVEMAVGFPEGPSYPGHSPFIFSLCCPLNDRRRAAHSIFKIGRLFSLFLLSCLTLALLRLLILLLLLMNDNVHPNPGPIFPCSVCAGNVTRQGKSVQYYTCSKWVHLRCSQLSLSNFKTLGSSHSWSCPPCCNTVTPPSSDSSDTYTSTVKSGPSSANAALLPHPRLQTSYPHLPILYLLPLPSHHRPLLLAILLHLLPPLLPLTLSGFFNGMLEVFEQGALNYFTFFHSILSTLSAFRNPILTHLPLSGFLDSLFCVLIAPTPGLSSLDPYSDYVGVNISKQLLLGVIC